MGAELIVAMRSKFDASGSQAAAKELAKIVLGSDRAGNAAKRMAGQFVDLEYKQRKVETATRVIGTEFANMARGGFSVASAAEAGAGAISFLGNALKFASGPLGIAVTVATALASALLMWKSNAESAKQATVELISTTEALSAAQQILQAQGRTADDETVERLKAMESEATTSGNLSKLALAQAAASAKLSEARRAEKVALDALNEATLRFTSSSNKEYDAYMRGGLTIEQAVSKQRGAWLQAQEATAEAAKAAGTYTAAMDRATAVVIDIAPPMDRLIDLNNNAADQMANKLPAAARAWSGALVEEVDVVLRAEEAAEKKKLAMRLAGANAASSIVSSMASLLATAGGEELEAVKALRIVEVGINAIAGSMQAIGTYGPTPVGYALAAASIAAGVAAAAQIASASMGSAPASAPSSAGITAGGPSSAGQSPIGSNVATTPAAPGYSGPSGGFSGTMNLTVNMQVNVLDPDAISNAQLRRIADRLTDLILFRINALGGTVSFG